MNYADELRDLDQALGDGDLGITVTLGAEAVIEALSVLPESATPAEIARECAKAFANANPSTMAALVAGGLLAGSKTWTELTEITVSDAARFVRAAGENIAKRGKTELGDKTILDTIMPAADALDQASDGASGLIAAIAGAERAVVDTTPCSRAAAARPGCRSAASACRIPARPRSCGSWNRGRRPATSGTPTSELPGFAWTTGVFGCRVATPHA